jgi:hypothetical protein
VQLVIADAEITQLLAHLHGETEVLILAVLRVRYRPAPGGTDDLYTGESVLISKPANMFIDLSAQTRWLVLIGQKREALGGKLFLTNYRLVFESHSLNSIICKVSFPLHTITGLRDMSWSILKKMAVDTAAGSAIFVVWGVRQFINTAQETMNSVDDARLREFQMYVSQDPGKLGTTPVGLYVKCVESKVLAPS